MATIAIMKAAIPSPVNADEVNSFSNLKPEEAIEGEGIEGSSDRPFYSSDESSDPDIYDDESADYTSFPDIHRNPVESNQAVDKNTTRETSETPSSAMKITIGLSLIFSYLL